MHRADLPREMMLNEHQPKTEQPDDVYFETKQLEESYTPLFYEEYKMEEFADLIKAQEEGKEDIYDET